MKSIRPESYTPALVCAAIAVVTMLAYLPLLQNSFIAFDDNIYIYQNKMVKQGLTWEGLRYAFSITSVTSYWHPLTWLSLMLDYELFGLNPVGYHLENLLLHILNAILLFTLLRKVTGCLWSSAAVAGLFSLHPLAVESVAWAVERKTVLSSLFFFMALLGYLRYVQRPSWIRYMQIVVFMATGLMAKSMIITLPLLLMILDFWPLRRWGVFGKETSITEKTGFLILEKIPLVVLSCASVFLSLVSLPQKSYRGTEYADLATRAAHAIVSYVQYIGRVAWPSGHSIFYPPPSGHDASVVAAAAAILLLITFLAASCMRKYPWVLAGWLWYCITLAPMSGLVRAGLWPGIADRFTYLPCIGLFMMAAWSTAEITKRFAPFKRPVVISAPFLYIAIALLSYSQCLKWKDTVTLFSDAVLHTPPNAVIHSNLGRALIEERGDNYQAELHLKEAIRLDKGFGEAHHDLGELYLMQGKPGKALDHLRIAAMIMPEDANVHNSLASALIDNGSYEEALPILDVAIRLEPNYANAYFNRGLALLNSGRSNDASDAFSHLLSLEPGNHDARINLAHILVTKGENARAIRELNTVLAARPEDEIALGILGLAFERSGMKPQALKVYRHILQTHPDDEEAQAGLLRMK